MAVVNVGNFINGKDSRWLQLEVCREFQRNKCSRSDLECKFAHPPPNLEVQNGRVTACYDSIKGRCNRDNPPCKYFHPPQHLKDQMLINGRNYLAFKNAVIQQMGMASPGQAIVPGQIPATATIAASPYITTAAIPQIGNTFSPYFAPGHLVHTMIGPDPSAPMGVIPQTITVTQQQKIQRSERLETFPGMVSYKRTTDKTGVQIYPANASTYQQLMQLQQPFVPVSLQCPDCVFECTRRPNHQIVTHNYNTIKFN